MTIVSSSFWNNSQITIARTVDDLVTIIQEKPSRSAAVGCSQVKSIKSLLVAISGIDGSAKGYVTEKIPQATKRQGLKAIALPQKICGFAHKLKISSRCFNIFSSLIGT